jgi:hypothetical protein
MKMADTFIESKGVSFDEAIFMHSGEPKDHGISARNDSPNEVFTHAPKRERASTSP